MVRVCEKQFCIDVPDEIAYSIAIKLLQKVQMYRNAFILACKTRDGYIHVKVLYPRVANEYVVLAEHVKVFAEVLREWGPGRHIRKELIEDYLRRLGVEKSWEEVYGGRNLYFKYYYPVAKLFEQHGCVELRPKYINVVNVCTADEILSMVPSCSEMVVE